MSQINKPNTYFNTKLYTGNGTDATSITGVGFSPEFTWIKERSSTSPHKLLDIIRGATKELESSSTVVEATEAASLQSFDSDGFTVGTNGAVNESGQTYASWNWKANGAGVSNTDGTITSTVSANTTSGFSIVTYSGDGGSSSTVGHGLGAIPKMVIIKCRTSTPSWQVWGDGYTRLSLNNTDGDLGSNGMTRGASTVTLPSGINDWNGSGQDYIMYCWSEVKGFSKFGKYTGNGSADGTFVYTGFKPAFVMVKRSDGAVNWQLIDNKRSDAGGNNIIDKVFAPNASDAEYDEGSSGWCGDLLSNGFKWRGDWGALNASGGTYIYMAFAENPLVGTNNIPATAR